MIVVADTSPLNYLVLIEEIRILEILYREIIVPTAVRDELLSEDAPAQVRRWMANPPTWLEIRSPLPVLRDPTKLDPGETDAIALAEQLKADRILIDEILGRREAMDRGLKVIGTLGVLRQAHREKLLDLPTALERLRSTSFYIAPGILQALLDSV